MLLFLLINTSTLVLACDSGPWNYNEDIIDEAVIEYMARRGVDSEHITSIKREFRGCDDGHYIYELNMTYLKDGDISCSRNIKVELKGTYERTLIINWPSPEACN